MFLVLCDIPGGRCVRVAWSYIYLPYMPTRAKARGWSGINDGEKTRGGVDTATAIRSARNVGMDPNLPPCTCRDNLC